jgi:predicted nuclease with TOPRIM domain|tara:strand:- start:980 stop:1213 length:234 start_codon:yes stop_codon:yes gene_type:complete
MVINEQTLQDERKVLETDFNAMSDRIKQVEKDLGQMKSNTNALYGAIQQVDRLLAKLKEGTNEMPVEKEKALNIATS